MKVLIFDTRVALNVSDDFNLLDYANQLSEHVHLVNDIDIHKQQIVGIQLIHEAPLEEKKVVGPDESSPFSRH